MRCGPVTLRLPHPIQQALEKCSLTKPHSAAFTEGGFKGRRTSHPKQPSSGNEPIMGTKAALILNHVLFTAGGYLGDHWVWVSSNSRVLPGLQEPPKTRGMGAHTTHQATTFFHLELHLRLSLRKSFDAKIGQDPKFNSTPSTYRYKTETQRGSETGSGHTAF